MSLKFSLCPANLKFVSCEFTQWGRQACYWTELSQTIQTAAANGNTRRMYGGIMIKTALGPIQSKTAPLKSTTGDVITDRAQQMHRWVEHY